FNISKLTYVVKFTDKLNYLLDDDFMLDYLFGQITNFDATQHTFAVTGIALDEDGNELTLHKDEHKSYDHISINKDTNSIEFDFNSFYTSNNIEPYIRQSVDGQYYLNNLGFDTPILVHDSDMLSNGTYEFKTAIVEGSSVDLDQISNAHSENLVI